MTTAVLDLRRTWRVHVQQITRSSNLPTDPKNSRVTRDTHTLKSQYIDEEKQHRRLDHRREGDVLVLVRAFARTPCVSLRSWSALRREEALGAGTCEARTAASRGLSSCCRGPDGGRGAGEEAQGGEDCRRRGRAGGRKPDARPWASSRRGERGAPWRRRDHGEVEPEIASADRRGGRIAWGDGGPKLPRWGSISGGTKTRWPSWSKGEVEGSRDAAAREERRSEGERGAGVARMSSSRSWSRAEEEDASFRAGSIENRGDDRGKDTST